MTNTQLYLAVGLPFVLFLLTFGNSIFQWIGLRREMDQIQTNILGIRNDIKEMQAGTRADMREMRVEIRDMQLTVLERK